MEDDFIPVRSKRIGRRKRLDQPNPAESTTDAVDASFVRGKLESAKNELICSDYWDTLKKALRLENTSVLVCLGLGQFSCSVTARWQTALLILLKEHVNVGRTVVYDPLFNDTERKLLSEFGCETPSENDEGFLDFGNSLFYMPHCGKPLFNSVVYANRRHLTSLTIFGNSFQAMFDQIEFRNRLKDGELAALRSIENLFQEVPVENIFQYKDVFNDLSVIRFGSVLLEDIPQPIYSTNDEIILREAMRSLTLETVDTNSRE